MSAGGVTVFAVTPLLVAGLAGASQGPPTAAAAAGWWLTQAQPSRVENGPAVTDLTKLTAWASTIGGLPLAGPQEGARRPLPATSSINLTPPARPPRQRAAPDEPQAAPPLERRHVHVVPPRPHRRRSTDLSDPRHRTIECGDLEPTWRPPRVPPELRIPHRETNRPQPVNRHPGQRSSCPRRGLPVISSRGGDAARHRLPRTGRTSPVVRPA
jgi:hypothetical protein